MVESVTSVTAGLAKPPLAATRDSGKESFKVEAARPQPAESTPVSPRLRFDATVGVVITEFLNRTGAVEAQTPNNAVLAYLRVGLGKDGRAVEENQAPEIKREVPAKTPV